MKVRVMYTEEFSDEDRRALWWGGMGVKGILTPPRWKKEQISKPTWRIWDCAGFVRSGFTTGSHAMPLMTRRWNKSAARGGAGPLRHKRQAL